MFKLGKQGFAMKSGRQRGNRRTPWEVLWGGGWGVDLGAVADQRAMSRRFLSLDIPVSFER